MRSLRYSPANVETDTKSGCFGTFAWDFGPDASPSTTKMQKDFFYGSGEGSIFPGTTTFHTVGTHTVTLSFINNNPPFICPFDPGTSIFIGLMDVDGMPVVPTISQTLFGIKTTATKTTKFVLAFFLYETISVHTSHNDMLSFIKRLASQEKP